MAFITLTYEKLMTVFCRVFQAFVCIATYGMSVPSLHTESKDSDRMRSLYDLVKHKEGGGGGGGGPQDGQKGDNKKNWVE